YDSAALRIRGLNVLPILLPQSKVSSLLDERLATIRRLAEKCWQHVDTIRGRLVRQLLVGQRGKRAEQVDLANERVGRFAGGQALGLGHDKWFPRAAFECSALSAAERAGRLMRAELFYRVVHVAVVDHGTVVAGKDYEGVVRQASLVDGFEDLSDAPVELRD